MRLPTSINNFHSYLKLWKDFRKHPTTLKKNISPKGELLHSLLISSVYQITACIMKYEVIRKSVQGDKQFEIDNMCCKRAFFISASLDLYLGDKEASKSR